MTRFGGTHCNPSILDVGAGGSDIQSHPQLYWGQPGLHETCPEMKIRTYTYIFSTPKQWNIFFRRMCDSWAKTDRAASPNSLLPRGFRRLRLLWAVRMQPMPLAKSYRCHQVPVRTAPAAWHASPPLLCRESSSSSGNIQTKFSL